MRTALYNVQFQYVVGRFNTWNCPHAQSQLHTIPRRDGEACGLVTDLLARRRRLPVAANKSL